jgi:hypothetical protein
MEEGEDVFGYMDVSADELRKNPSAFGIDAYQRRHGNGDGEDIVTTHNMGYLETNEVDEEEDESVITAPERNTLFITDKSRQDQIVATIKSVGLVRPQCNVDRFHSLQIQLIPLDLLP